MSRATLNGPCCELRPLPRAAWLLAALTLAAAVAGSLARVPPAAAEAPTAEPAEKTAETPAAKPAPSPSGESPPGSAAESLPSAPPPRQTLLDTIRAGGLVGAIIILLSMISVGFMVEHTLTIRKSVLMPDPVIEELDQLISQGKIDEAMEACRVPENHSLFSHVVLAGLERYKGSEFGFAEYKAAVEEAGEEQTARLYRKTEILSVIGSIAPMLGLLGTVTGMIRAFNAIVAKQGMAQPQDLAGGISEALVTTVEGLVVAIPTMCAFTYFRSRIDSLVAEAGKRVEQVMMPLGRRKT